MALHLFHPFRRHQHEKETPDMPTYVVHSDSPITSKEVHRPDLPDFPTRPGEPDIGLPGPGRPSLPEGWEPPTIPPKDEWPPLPPWFEPHPGNPLPLPIPPRPGEPTVPLPPVDPEIDELPEIWPPLPPTLPELPDLSGKTLVLACFFVSRKVKFYRWVVIDHEEAKSKLEKAVAWIKSKLPAGGIAGRPPQRPGPS